MSELKRRELLTGAGALAMTGLAGCGGKDAGWCDQPLYTDDGDYPYPEACPPTASNTEGPYYRADAPERTDLTTFGDSGTPLTLSGQVFDGGCDAPLARAVVEFWQADPDGEYDNDSEEMRYRCRVTCDDQGRYSLSTLLPGLYLNGLSYRPRHIHVKVLAPDGAERLTTQLYFEGDPHIECDALANTSLVLPFQGSEDTEMSADDVFLVV